MPTLLIFLIIFLNISPYQCVSPLCRTNCSTHDTIDSSCWQDALIYRSSELIDQLFSFGSLALHVDRYQELHPRELNDTIILLVQSFENHLKNESIDSRLPLNLFTQTKEMLVNLCRNLTSTRVESVDQLPSLSCSKFTCSSDILNYIILFVISTILASLILIICVVQFLQTRRQAPSSAVATQQTRPLINPHCSINT